MSTSAGVSLPCPLLLPALQIVIDGGQTGVLGRNASLRLAPYGVEIADNHSLSSSA